MSMRRTLDRPRRHGPVLEPQDRRWLERSGWRTTLEYRENHVRARDGRLVEIVPEWTAEAECFDGQVAYASAIAESADAAWAMLRGDVDAGRVTCLARLRLVAR